MDMFSSGFASPWPFSRTLRWRAKQGRLVVLQSITANKSELVQELVGGNAAGDCLQWCSFSDWDSTALLPTHVCQFQDGIRPGCRGVGPEAAREREQHHLILQAQRGDLRLLQELTDPQSVPLVH